MRFSSAFFLALPAFTVAEQQVPLLDKVKGLLNKATAAVSSAAPSAAFNAVTVEAASKAAESIQYPITLSNWREVVTLDPTVSVPTTQNWLIFVTGGNSTCFGLCGNATKAWNTSLPLLAAKPNPPKFAYLDCESEPVLCNAWSVSAPSLCYFQIPKPLADQSAPIPTVRYQPLNRSSTTLETFKTFVIDNEIEKVEPYEGLFHPFNGLLEKYQLATPYGYFIWAFSKVPSWMPMLFVSFFTRSFMNKRVRPNPPQNTAQPARAR